MHVTCSTGATRSARIASAVDRRWLGLGRCRDVQRGGSGRVGTESEDMSVECAARVYCSGACGLRVRVEGCGRRRLAWRAALHPSGRGQHCETLFMPCNLCPCRGYGRGNLINQGNGVSTICRGYGRVRPWRTSRSVHTPLPSSFFGNGPRLPVNARRSGVQRTNARASPAGQQQ